jgi:hypothetical protein
LLHCRMCLDFPVVVGSHLWQVDQLCRCLECHSGQESIEWRYSVSFKVNKNISINQWRLCYSEWVWEDCLWSGTWNTEKSLSLHSPAFPKTCNDSSYYSIAAPA